MKANVGSSTIDSAVMTRNLLFVLLGVGVFLLRRLYTGPLQEVVHAYAGNVSVSFALYFVLLNLQVPFRIRRLTAATLAFAAVELFEAFNGFGVMANYYDPVDFAANAVGIALALGLDAVLGSHSTRHGNSESA
jgi:hypothetical protein